MKNPFKIFNKEKTLNNVPQNGWWRVITEPFAGAWQRNIEYRRKDVLAYHAVFACTTIIASDISKLKINLQRVDDDGIWFDVPFSNFAVINRPNSYQNRIQFYESWMLSKLIRGNAYIWKVRRSGIVTEMHVLNPDLVLPMVSDDGQVFYQIGTDNLAGIQETGLTVPASEIIHDRFNCMYHPLVGLSPLYAAGLPAFAGLKIMENSATHFANGARPSGILVVPEAIKPEQAAAMSTQWKEKYSGDNYGNIAVLGGDVKYQSISMTAEESQLVELLGMTDEKVCSCYHVPPYKVGLGAIPNYNNVQSMNVEYLNSALQRHIEDLELCLKEGLEIKDGYRVNVDEDGLLRMDTKTQTEVTTAELKGGIRTNNEARKKSNLPPIDGGNTIWMQQQDYPIEVLATRRSPDAQTTPPEVTPAKMADLASLFKKELSA